jgi:uncharacterized SAM-binding protein YcdF (DUF218 family)
MKDQDWYYGIVKAVELLNENPDSEILVLTAMQVEGQMSEADLYVHVLVDQLGVDSQKVWVINECRETVGQLETASELAFNYDYELVVVSTKLHSPRVKWICWKRGIVAEHYKVDGNPRPAEVTTDKILNVIFPMIDTIPPLRNMFLRLVGGRRSKGNQF